MSASSEILYTFSFIDISASNIFKYLKDFFLNVLFLEQTFVFVSYTQTFGDNNGKLWEDAYTGTGLANGIMCILSALYFVLVIPERSTIL